MSNGDNIAPLARTLKLNGYFTAQFGKCPEVPLSPDDGSRGDAFDGRVKGVKITIADVPESADRRVSPEVAVRIAMARH